MDIPPQNQNPVETNIQSNSKEPQEASTQTEIAETVKNESESQTEIEQHQKSVGTEIDTFYLDSPTKSNCRDLIVYAPPNYYPFSSIYIKHQQFHYQYLISQAFTSHFTAEGMGIFISSLLPHHPSPKKPSDGTCANTNKY